MTPQQAPETSADFPKPMLILRWISLVIEIFVFGVYLYISLGYGESGVLPYAVLGVAVCLEVVDIIGLPFLHSLILGLLELGVTAVFFYTLAILVPIGYPVYRPWNTAAFLNVYATLVLVLLHFVFAIVCLVRGFSTLFEESSGSGGERDPLLARNPPARDVEEEAESATSDSSSD